MAPNTHGGGVYVGCASIRRRPLFVSVPQIGFGKTMRTQLYKRVADYMFAIYQWISGHGPMPFEPKAPGLFVDMLEYQRLNHPLYGKYCEINGCTKRGSSIFDYPPLPVEAFKRADICPFEADQVVAEFYSSGTTEGVHSVHKFRDIGLVQRTNLLTFSMWMLQLLPKLARFYSLMPTPADNPHSSLGFMIAQFVDGIGAPGSGSFFTMENGLDAEGLCDALEQSYREEIPVYLMGPSFAWVHLLDQMGDRTIKCAPGSSLLETGGYKGKSREVPRSELRNALASKLGLNRRFIYGEYGMCELSSQGYEICALNTTGELPQEGLYIFPPWLKCIVFNPDDMSPVMPGNPGQIAFCDLCNLDSAAYILTGDVGTMVELPAELRQRIKGYPRFALNLAGRAHNAVPKGCSIAWDEWAQNR